ncbi:hypothetical protein G9P44_000863 [Scheffersomyces stipitis]|nr:hypothetical protein G9P44_000863 [Scheffersomyces stipitis]
MVTILVHKFAARSLPHLKYSLLVKTINASGMLVVLMLVAMLFCRYMDQTKSKCFHGVILNCDSNSQLDLEAQIESHEASFDVAVTVAHSTGSNASGAHSVPVPRVSHPKRSQQVAIVELRTQALRLNYPPQMERYLSNKRLYDGLIRYKRRSNCVEVLPSIPECTPIRRSLFG